jgi:two-component system, sporulation sensor kinase E
VEKPLEEMIEDSDISGFFSDNLRGLDKVLDREFTIGDGYSRTLSLSIMPLVRQGKITGNVIHIEDVTDKRAKEARLRRAESLAALTTLTAGVAHEIKNPLGSIGIHIELMKKEMNGKRHIETKKVKENLLIIKEEVDRLNRIVMDFLFTVRPMNAELAYGDLNRLVRELLEFLKFELKQADVEVEVELAEPSPQILMDDRYMKQAVLNIIKNAISAMPEGGILKVQTRQSEGSFGLVVRDNGVGIPDENMDKVFEPYFTTKDFGSGLGLTLVYKIVKEHMGDIEVSSKVGEGTSFTLSFPIPQKEKRLIGYSEEGQ